MPRALTPKGNVDEIHEQNLAHIRLQPVRVAYLYLVRTAERLKGFDCYPMFKGVIRDFRYVSEDEMPFAFIVNLDSLLFYIRKPVFDRFKPRLPNLREVFADVSLPRDYEITFRINDIRDAKRVMQEVFDVVNT